MAKCNQCEDDFDAKSINHMYCTRACQVDHLRGVKPEMSLRRKKTGYAWEPVKAARKVVISIPKATSKPLSNWKTALILPDPQFGYHWSTEGLDPYHDERSLSIVRQIARDERPDLAIWLGDVLDLPMFSRFKQFPSFAHTFQPTLDRAHEEIAVIAELCGESRYISGNHDERLHNAVVDNLSAAAGVRVAKRSTEPGDEWPALSIPNLLALPDLGVEYVGAYPAGATYINDNLAAIHGRKLGNKKRSAAQEVVEDERVSVIYGHTHHRALAAKTRNSRGAAKYNVAYSPGCLCRIDGIVPGTNTGIDPFGNYIRSFADWQQGVGIIRYEEGDGRFVIEDIPIFDQTDGTQWASHRGTDYYSEESNERRGTGN